jgi:GT2 family glycosyltransferase
LKALHNISVLIAVHNRIDFTLSCLNSLYKNNFTNQFVFKIFLLDDNSNDGTKDIIKKYFPEIILLEGTGNLFWSRSMNQLWTIASSLPADYFLWLNNDTILNKNAISHLLECLNELSNSGIVSGILTDKYTNEVIYGGTNFDKLLLHPNGYIQDLFHLNGNVVLIPYEIFINVGNIDVNYHHDLGDLDYGFRVQEKGYRTIVSKMPIGQGFKNNICRVRKNKSNLFNRFYTLYSPLGSPPFINFYFRKKYYGLINAVMYFVFLHFLNLIPDLLNDILFKKRYQ